MNKTLKNQYNFLIEAYNDVYASQELTEEQIWEKLKIETNKKVALGIKLNKLNNIKSNFN